MARWSLPIDVPSRLLFLFIWEIYFHYKIHQSPITCDSTKRDTQIFTLNLKEPNLEECQGFERELL